MAKIQTALVVDDSRLARIALSKQLKKRDIEVEVAGNGTEAVAHLRERRPDVVFMDFMMPDMDGFEATRRVRELPELGELPVVMYTSQDTPEDRARGAELGVRAFLIKPSSEDRLEEILALLAKGESELQAAAAPAAQPAAPAPETQTEPAPAAADPAPAPAEIPWEEIRGVAVEAGRESAADAGRQAAEQPLAALRAELEEVLVRAEAAGREAGQSAAAEAAREAARQTAAEAAEQRVQAAVEALAERLRQELRGQLDGLGDSESFRAQLKAVVEQDLLPGLQQPIVEMTRKIARESAQACAQEALAAARPELEQLARESAAQAAVEAGRNAAAEAVEARKPKAGAGVIAAGVVVAGALIAAAVLVAL